MHNVSGRPRYGAAVQIVRTNGLEIAYERRGAGPPLVFVHGAAEDGRAWQAQLAALADESPSSRGTSRAPEAPPTYPQTSD